jgi:FAD synthase
MDFVQRIRSQKKFRTEQSLASQIAQDCEKAKKILSGNRM